MRKQKTGVAKASSETGLSTAKQFTQADIPSLLETVKAQIAEIKKGIPEKKQTTGDLDGFGPIDSLTTVESLIKAHSSVTGRARAYEASAKALPLKKKTPKFTISGHSEQAWVDDINARIVVVEHEQELKKLEQVKEKLESNLSAEAKLSKDLADIHGILSEE